MSGLARRRTAGVGAFLLLVSVLALTFGGLASATDNPGGKYEPPEGCVKIDSDGIGKTTLVMLGDVEASFTWNPKPGESGEYTGFDWSTDPSTPVYGTVKASTDVYDWGPGSSGTFTVPPDDGIVHGISFVIVCAGEDEEPESGTIVIRKLADPDDTDDEFLIDVWDGWFYGPPTADPMHQANLASGQSRSFDVDAGDYTLAEELSDAKLEAGWLPTGVTCDGGLVDSGFEEDGAVLWAEVEVEAGETITCTFRNEKDEEPIPELGSITVVKVTQGGTGTFGFDFFEWPASGPTHQFDLVTTGTGQAGNDTEIISGLEAGDHGIYEDEPATGWTLTEVFCDGEYEPSGPRGVVVSLEEGDDITCTFVNEYEEDAQPPDESTVPSTSTSVAEQQVVSVVTATTTAGGTLPFTGDSSGGPAALGLSLAALGAALIAIAASARKVDDLTD